ncbi:MAG: hypothetical protein CMB48_07395 [Euryarchaeota archaeon]|nr:hypothetical protein [Euryarchaeota archaeon]|tara:strand:+ start:723 stop:1220 length:498 start_codon:yes stop_codon:yes gene_type:complete
MESNLRFKIRLAKLNDLELITEFWWCLIKEQEIYDDRIVNSDFNKHKSVNFLRERIVNGNLFVAESQNLEILGLGTISKDFHFLQTNFEVWNIADIWIKKEFRRKNIASEIIERLETVAKEQGADEIRLTVYSGNLSAISLYQKLKYNPKIITFSKPLSTDLNTD